MRRAVIVSLSLGLAPSAFGQVSFTYGTDRLNNDLLTSGVAMGVVDMNGDGLDDLVRLDDAQWLEIELQQSDGSFERVVYGDTHARQWSLSIADVDGNGTRDMFVGGSYNGLQILRGNADGTDWMMAQALPDHVFTQCSSFTDIDNDGAVDLFICHDDGLSVPLRNGGGGGFTLDYSLINPVSTVPSDNSGNYGIVWTDYDDDGDVDMYLSKCRLNVHDPMDGRRLNLLFENDGHGGFTERAEAAGLRPGGQSWAADFADIDNDGDLDVFLINHDIPSQLYVNDGDGTFTDVTAGSGILVSDMVSGIQAMFEDFDNDGYVDLLYTASQGTHYLYRNDGDGTFTEQFGAFPTQGLRIQSAATGDLDNDGDIDVLAGFADNYNNPTDRTDRLFLNDGNDNHWLKVRLVGRTSNPDAIGARVELEGAWGEQVREVRGGEGYGITRSFTRHFGLGAETSATLLRVQWPSGEVFEIEDPPIDTTLVLDEAGIDIDGDGSIQGEDCDDRDPSVIECAPEDTADTDPPDTPIGPSNEKTCGCAASGAPVLGWLVLVGLFGARRR